MVDSIQSFYIVKLTSQVHLGKIVIWHVVFIGTQHYLFTLAWYNKLLRDWQLSSLIEERRFDNYRLLWKWDLWKWFVLSHVKLVLLFIFWSVCLTSITSHGHIWSNYMGSNGTADWRFIDWALSKVYILITLGENKACISLPIGVIEYSSNRPILRQVDSLGIKEPCKVTKYPRDWGWFKVQRW